MATSPVRTETQPPAPSPASPGVPVRPQRPAAGHVRPAARPVSGRRLIVLVPDQGIDDAELARRIWEFASPARLAVLYLGLCRNAAEEAQMRRRLITLSALTSEPRVDVITKLEFGSAWIRAVKTILRDDDILVCHAEQRTGFRQRPLSRVLETLGAPIWTLTGFSESIHASTPEPLKEIVFWVVSIAVVIGFTWLQIRVARLSKDWAQSALLYLSILVEAGVLWSWHQLSS